MEEMLRRVLLEDNCGVDERQRGEEKEEEDDGGGGKKAGIGLDTRVSMNKTIIIQRACGSGMDVYGGGIWGELYG